MLTGAGKYRPVPLRISGRESILGLTLQSRGYKDVVASSTSAPEKGGLGFTGKQPPLGDKRIIDRRLAAGPGHVAFGVALVRQLSSSQMARVLDETLRTGVGLPFL